jgi:mono/diheme cytochrome c family protein
MLRPILLLSALIVLGSAGITKISVPLGPQDAAQAPASAPEGSNLKNPAKPTPESHARAKKMYGFDCAMCHGANGNGKTDLAKDMQLTLSDWTDSKSLAGKSDGELFEIIRKGKDKMPPEDASRANDEVVWNLVFYIRSMSKGGASETEPAGQN